MARRGGSNLIVGIGTDLCEVARVEKALQKDTFLRGIYSAAEQDLILSNVGKSRVETAAANFAAKEAFLKACGMGLGDFPLAEIGVLRKASGAPYYALEGSAARWLEERRLTTHLSLTHESGLACAFAILEQREGGDS